MTKPPLELVKSNKEQRAEFNSDGLRVIRHNPGKLPELLAQCEQALADANGSLFVQPVRLVRIYPAKVGLPKAGGKHGD